ncbi:hypothetical protein AAVH_26639 [Aphelenchoides avenae]|nr:hypothetical protein AAVH_26639 [Aphelenchus avenae]
MALLSSDSETDDRFARRRARRCQPTDDTSVNNEGQRWDRDDSADNRSNSRPQNHRRSNSPSRGRHGTSPEHVPEEYEEVADARDHNRTSHGRSTFRRAAGHGSHCRCYECQYDSIHGSECGCSECAHTGRGRYCSQNDSCEVDAQSSEDDSSSSEPPPEDTFTDHGTTDSGSEPDSEETASDRPHDYCPEPNRGTPEYRPDYEEPDSDALPEHDGDDAPRRDETERRYEDDSRHSCFRHHHVDDSDGQYEDGSRQHASRRHRHDDSDGRYQDGPRPSSFSRCHDDDIDGRYEDRFRQHSSRGHDHDDSDGRY